MTAKMPTEQPSAAQLGEKCLLGLVLFVCISELVAVQVAETRKKIRRPTVPIFVL
jgi:hypothetical protein